MDSAERASDLTELSEKKRRMIAYLLGKSKKETSRPTRASIPRLSATEAPLSFAQQRLWFIEQFEPNTSAYHIAAALNLFGPLKVEAIGQSLTEIIRRHEALRTRFDFRDGEPVQIIEPPAAFELPLLDLTDLHDPETAARGQILQEVQKPFDLSNCPLVRTILFKLAPQHHIALFTMHHIISDGWSLGVLLRELTALYAARGEGGGARLAPLRVQYADYAVWQRQWLRGIELEEQLEYWREQLAGAAGVLEMRGDRPRPAVQSFRGAVEVLELSRDLSGALQHLSRIQGVTLFVTLLAAFNVLLHKYTSQQSLCVGTPIAGRNKAELEPLIGFFINMLVMRTRVSADSSFLALLAQVKQTAFDAYAHQDLPFERLVEELRPDRRLSHTPLFQVMFALQNIPFDTPRLSGLTVRMIEIDMPTAKFDLALYLSQGEQGLTATLNYSTDLFDAVTIRRMLGHFQTLLVAIAADADAKILGLPILTEPERALILVGWNDTEAEYPRGKPVQELFEAQVEAGPDRAALVYEGHGLTYGELNRRANQLAHFLRGLGVGPEAFAGVYVQRSLEMVICLLGIIKAGGAYVPLDPEYPEGRLAFILEATGLSVLLTSKELADRLSVFAGRKVCIAEEWDSISGQREQNPAVNIKPENLIYVNYTSGSTGRPKGVLAHHESVVSYLSFIAAAYSVSGNDKVLQVPSLSFDASVRDIFAPLITGAQLVITDSAHAKQPSALVRNLREHSITCLLSIVPTLLRAVVEAACEAEPFAYPLRLMLAAGEKLSLSDCEKARSAFGGLEIINQYGATECTMSSTYYRIGSSDGERRTALIGKPIHNTRLYNLDSHLNPVPVNVMGEVYIGGIGLSRGYIDRPELSADRFVPDPCDEKPGGRLYRTGDLARYLSDGHLELVGRVDHQVKVRGFRIELGEIEAVLGEHEAVKDKVVIVREDEPESPRIVAYAALDGRALAPADLRGFLKERLPEYMLPATIIILDRLPLNPNGKIDRAALPPPEPASHPQDNGSAPFRSPTEEILAGIWAEVLGARQVSARDNFFALGGHSLRAAQVVTRVRKALSSEIDLKSLFETDDLASFARKVESSLQAGHSPLDQPIPIATRDGDLPLSFAQQRLWLLYLLDPESPAYNIPMALSVRGRLNIPALEESLREIIRRHEILRTRFASVEGKPVQFIVDSAGFTLPVVDLSRLAERSQTEARRLASAAAQTPFQLEREPLLRAHLIELRKDEYVVLIIMHHIISDGWSLGVLLRELTALYAAGSEGRPAALAPLRVQYGDYAVWQRQWLAGEGESEHMDYWRAQLTGAAGVLELNSDRPRPVVQSFRGAAQSFSFTKPLTEQIRTLSRRAGATLFMILVAALKSLLCRHTQQEDLILGTPVANRTRAELEPLIGVFVNTLVLRTDLSGDPTFRTLLSRVRRVALDAYAHQDVPFEHLVDVLQPRRSLSYTPFFQVMFVLQNVPIDEFTMPGLSVSRMEIDRGTAKFDLLFSMNESEDELIGTVEYNCDLFDATTIWLLVEHYGTLLESAVTNPDQRLSELALLSEAERHQLIVAWNETQAAYPDDCIHTMFETQVEQTPDALALVYEDRGLSYAELNRRANQLARHLRRLGLSPEQLAGVCMHRSPQMVVALLAIMKTGAAYVPFDPAYPDERLAFVIKDSQASVLLTQQHLSATFGALGARVVLLDSDWDEVAVNTDENLDSGLSAQNLAYVIYTSGSTGKPKGVAIRHHSAATMLSWAREVYTDEDITAVLASTSICFDLSVFELFLPLCFGGKVVLVTDVLRLAEPPLLEPVTLINTVPSAAAELLRFKAIPNSAKVINLAGEALQNALVQRLYQDAGVERVFNLYGPTEDTTYSSFARIERGADRPPPIGRPITNTRVYLSGKLLEPVPAGVPGEIYLGGCGLARCYFNRPELTAGKFIPDPFSRCAGERLYGTGDLARYLPNGELEFLGRRDAQIKLRGFRIELTEIESVLREHPQVRDAAVAVVADGAGQKRLAAYSVFAGKQSTMPGGLRAFLQKRLPDYMVPALFVELERLPLTPNGKLNRQALPAPDDGRPALEKVFVAPQTPTETVLADHWADLLGMARVGIHDSFFEVGGDSLLGTQLVSRIYGEFDVRLPLRAIFERPTIAELAALIEQVVVEQTEDLSEEEAEALLKSDSGVWASSAERESL